MKNFIFSNVNIFTFYIAKDRVGKHPMQKLKGKKEI